MDGPRPHGHGFRATERVVEHKIESEVMRPVAHPADADSGRQEMGRVTLLNIVDDVTMWSCSFGPPQEACPY